jgi:plastocyanin
MNRTRFVVMTFVVFVFFGVAAAGAGSNLGARVDMTDDCDPATFNAAIGPGTCVGGGETTFQDFVAQLRAQGSADGWAFDPGKLRLKPGANISVRNEGGEFHTFTEVANYGGGCIAALNTILGLTPVPECLPLAGPNGPPLAFITTGVQAGGSRSFAALAPGVHRFECLIHPWMRTTVTVANGRGGDD